ncbi:MAG: response regulator [Candidatus Korobacteraceae bacterium]|jgi:DNA-binding response OmpR family regulator
MTEYKGRILVVDDEEDVTTFLGTLLEDNGYSVIKAADGKRGLEMARSESPDLIILDICMPEETGVRMFRNLQEDAQTNVIPVIILTGVSHEFKRFIENRRHLCPPAGYFDKPPDREELLTKVAELVAVKHIV